MAITLEEFAQQLTITLEAQLKETEGKAENMLRRAEQSYLIVEHALKELKAFVYNYVFTGKAEEIHFFKCIKPPIYSRLIYFIRVFQIETKMPVGSVKVKKKYLVKEQELIKNCFANNQDFYRYYRAASNYLDEEFFLRGRHNLSIGLDGHYIDADPLFTTSHDHKLARIIAYEDLIAYLGDKIEACSIKLNPSVSADAGTEFRWTDAKAGLIELLMVCKALGL